MSGKLQKCVEQYFGTLGGKQQGNRAEAGQRAGKEEGKAPVKSRHCQEQPSLLWSVLFFDSFLLIYTVGSKIFCLHPGELITLGDLFTVMFYTSCSCALSFICTQHFLSLPQFFSIFIKCKWRDFFFSLQSLQMLESIDKLELLGFFIFKAKFSKLKRMTAS